MAPATLIVVGYPRDDRERLFTDVRQAATVTNSLGIHNEEYGKPIWICRKPLKPLSDVWPELKSLD
ncbi:MAG TPA: hypothetical protein VM674_00090 [Candidatus Acidoferrum sp.]|nr:hypothetical protein [Candidatus Acidoferrum sp.]